MAFKLPEKYRMKDHPLYPPEESKAAGAGAFVLPGVTKSGVIRLLCIASAGEGWEHVSITLFNEQARRGVPKDPSWLEMCYVKDVFWDKEDYAVQFHPPESEYVNFHPNCLHLWRPTGQQIKLPPSIMVGPSSAKKSRKQ